VADKNEVTVTAEHSQFPACQTQAGVQHDSSTGRRPTTEEEEKVEAAETSSAAAFEGQGAVKLGVDEIAPHRHTSLFFFR